MCASEVFDEGMEWLLVDLKFSIQLKVLRDMQLR